MGDEQAEKVDLVTPDLAAEKRAVLAELFPGAVTDGVLDAVKIGALIDLEVAASPDARERFGLQWAGKQEAVRSLLSPSRATLVPDLTNSIDFDTAQNVFIEGDNLEVLKLLQKSYNDTIKLIYIDPPYNTGNDFVYDDDFSDGLRAYLEYTGQVDQSGARLSATSETRGRLHSRWLSMMYPRLMLARNLLSQDGVLFVSIDDNELSNLKLLLDEVFGPENFLACVTVVSNLKGRSDDKYFATAHNYLLAYQRSVFSPRGVPLPQAYRDDYPETDESGGRFRLQGLRKRGSSARREDRPSMFYPFYLDPKAGTVRLTPGEGHSVEIYPHLSDGSDGRWRWGRATAESRLNELMGRQVGPDRRWDVFQIDHLNREGAERRAVPKTVWDGPEMANEAGTLTLKELLGERLFDTPKPVGLIRQILEHSVGEDDVVLDFFAGSGSTAHAVALMNADDGGSRRCISVNIPEPTSPGSAAQNAGLETVSQITLASLKKVVETVPGARAMGLRVLRLDSGSFRQKSNAESTFDLHETTLASGKPDWNAVASQVFLAEGVALDTPITRSGATIASDGVAIIATTELDESIVETALELNTRVLVFMEDAFAGRDALKANAVTNARNKGITLKTV